MKIADSGYARQCAKFLKRAGGKPPGRGQEFSFMLRMALNDWSVDWCMHEQQLCRQTCAWFFYCHRIGLPVTRGLVTILCQCLTEIIPDLAKQCSSAHNHHQSCHCITFAKPSISCLLYFLIFIPSIYSTFLIRRIFTYSSPSFLLHLGDNF